MAPQALTLHRARDGAGLRQGPATAFVDPVDGVPRSHPSTRPIGACCRQGRRRCAGGRRRAGDAPDDDGQAAHRSPGGLWRRFGVFALVLTGAGVAPEGTTERIGSSIGIGETAAGALLAGVATSLTELVTSVAAVRTGALALAVGNIVGSALDLALLSLADVFDTDGSIFELLGRAELNLPGLCLALTVLLVIGLAREPAGRRRVAAESMLMIVAYIAVVVMLIAEGGSA